MCQAQSILETLLSYEQQSSLINKKIIYQAIEGSIRCGEITFIVFSCLATKRGQEELIVDFFKTLFFDGGLKVLSHNVKRVNQIVDRLEQYGLAIKILPILVDTEPRRTWGWEVAQDELTLDCEIMLEQARESDLLNNYWQPKLWSQLESGYQGKFNFEYALNLTKMNGKHSILVSQQLHHLKSFADRYYFPFGLNEAAIRQVAAYAFEGLVLESLMPNAILLQSEYPASEKDSLYQWLRNKKQPLPIIHPFIN